jgi:hypothetical protein
MLRHGGPADWQVSGERPDRAGAARKPAEDLCAARVTERCEHRAMVGRDHT